MEGVSTKVYKGLKGYWRRRRYERLNGTKRRRQSRIELGSNKKRRFWKIKISPKVKLKLRFSPKKLCIGLRDAYVKMMMRIASSGMMVAGGGNGGFGARPMKEYDERMIIQVYKSILIAQGQPVPRDVSKISTNVLCNR